MSDEALTIALNRAVGRHFGKRPVSTLEIKIACGALLVAYLGQIPNVEERRESVGEFIVYLCEQLQLGEGPTRQ